MSYPNQMPPSSSLPPPVPRELVATGLQMKRRNPWLAWLLWPLLTLGIYHLVWYYKIHREMAEFDRRRAVPVVGPMLVLLFLSWTVIAPLVSYYNAAQRIRNAQRAAGMRTSCIPVVALLLSFLLGANTVYCQYQLNKIVDKYGAPVGTQVPLFV